MPSIKISLTQDFKSLQEIEEELADRYGKIPTSVNLSGAGLHF